MTLRKAGEARLSRLRGDDVLLMEIDGDLYTVALHRLAALTAWRADFAPISRRYPGTGGHYVDIEIQYTLRRSRTRQGLVMWMHDAVYTMSLGAVLDVVRGLESAVDIARIVTDAEQLSDATSKQTALGAF